MYACWCSDQIGATNNRPAGICTPFEFHRDTPSGPIKTHTATDRQERCTWVWPIHVMDFSNKMSHMGSGANLGMGVAWTLGLATCIKTFLRNSHSEAYPALLCLTQYRHTRPLSFTRLSVSGPSTKVLGLLAFE